MVGVGVGVTGLCCRGRVGGWRGRGGGDEAVGRSACERLRAGHARSRLVMWLSW